jgi:putative ABC transport system permease protein
MGPALRMIVRNMERRPLRTALSIVGVAAAVAIVIMGHFFRDAIDVVIDTQLTLGLRGDVTVWSAEPVDDAVRHDLARVPGCTASNRRVSCRSSSSTATARARPAARLRGACPSCTASSTRSAARLLLDGRGLVLTDRLAAKLGLRAGDPCRSRCSRAARARSS